MTGGMIRVADPEQKRLAALCAELARVKGRRVTRAEAIAYLLDMLDSQTQLMQDIAAGKPE